MKSGFKFFLLLFVVSIVFDVTAQINKTNLITNPSFETGDLTGWTWTGTTGYAWLGPNTDGDATKHGSNICGIWNGSIGDAECAQAINGLPDGYYRVTALATVSTGRVTNQRLFANDKFMLYGASSHAAYSVTNLGILGATEAYSFGGYAESAAETGPFKKLSVCTQVTGGTLNIGFRVSGKSTTKGYSFSYSTKADAGFFKFDNFTLTEVSNDATLDNISLSTGALNEPFDPTVTEYTASLPVGTSSVAPMVIPVADGQVITGNAAVDVSGGTGTSTITVKSYDGTATKTYTIHYTVLTETYTVATDGVLFYVPGGRMKVKVCTDKIIQLSYSTGTAIPAKDTIIVNKVWDTPTFNVTENADLVKISTASLDVNISKSSFLVSYYDKAGVLILSESNKAISPITITTANTTTKTFTCSAAFNSPVTEALYGLGQHQAGVMNHKGKTQTLDQQNCEVALPFLVSSLGYGILWDNYSYTNFDGAASSNTKYQFSSESGKMLDYYFMYGPEIDSVISNYRIASGAAPMFPKWSYGLFQSKDKYNTSVELLDIVNKYRTAGIPLDCIVQDWDYWTPDLWGSHTVDASRYPDPKALIDSLHSINVHSMISIWPVFHSSTANYKAFADINAIYPSLGGAHHFYDPHNETARQLYWSQVDNSIFNNHGWDAWWADNDEPAGYPDAFDRRDFVTAKGAGVTYYNTYPIQHTAGVYNGWRANHTDKRMFTLSRSAFSGQQRYATGVWSGDINSTWDSYQKQLSGGLNFSLSGMPYWTTDIGGYWSTDWTLQENQELMIRWFQYGTFCPLFRVHGKGDKALVSNQSFTKNTIDQLTKFDKLRYRLMPYIYSTAWKVTSENYTVMRHLIMDYRTDANVKNIDNQFLFGPSLMINPVTTAGVSKRNVYLPAGTWFDFWTGKTYSGSQTVNAEAPLDKIPVFVKAGSVIPMGPDITYANQSVDPTEIRVYKGANGSFTLYEDEGDTYNYEKGEYSEIPFTYNDNTKQLTIGSRKGSFNKMLTNRLFKIVLVAENYGVGLADPVTYDSIVHYTGNEVVVNFDLSRIKPQLHYEAENATLSGSAVVASVQTAYTGTGYVNGFNLSRNAAVSFHVNAPKAGLYKLNLRYSSGSGADRRKLGVKVNTNNVIQLTCDSTKNWSTWGEIPFIAKLDSGANVIQYSGDSVYVALDYLDLSLPTSQAFYVADKRVCRIKQLFDSKYISSLGNTLLVSAKDTTNRKQLWRIEKTANGKFKLTSEDNGQCLTVNQPSLTDGAKISTKVYTNLANQQWDIDDFGSNVFQIVSANSKLCLSVSVNDTLVQLTNTYLPSQLWTLEDTVALPITSAYEPFNYAEGSTINSQGAIGNGWGSAWTVYDGTATDITAKAPTAYAGLTTSGNKLTAALSTASGLRIYRDLSPRWKDDGGNIWLSFLFEIKNPTSLAASWQGLSLFNGSDERLLIGKNWGRSLIGINGNGAGEGLSTTNALNLTQSWVVVKIVTSGNNANENAYMWINPDPKTEPQLTTANATSAVQINSGFDRIVCHLGNTAGITSSFDEIRIGKSFHQITNPLISGINDIKADDGRFKIIMDNVNHTSKISFISTSFDKGLISMYDISGRKCVEKTVGVSVGNNEYTINTNKQGIYFVSFKTNRAVFTGKIIVQ